MKQFGHAHQQRDDRAGTFRCTGRPRRQIHGDGQNQSAGCEVSPRDHSSVNTLRLNAMGLPSFLCVRFSAQCGMTCPSAQPAPAEEPPRLFAYPDLKNPKGHIGFLGHGSVLWFRNIQVMDLKPQ
jgi:hypothetical protein